MASKARKRVNRLFTQREQIVKGWTRGWEGPMRKSTMYDFRDIALRSVLAENRKPR